MGVSYTTCCLSCSRTRELRLHLRTITRTVLRQCRDIHMLHGKMLPQKQYHSSNGNIKLHAHRVNGGAFSMKKCRHLRILTQLRRNCVLLLSSSLSTFPAAIRRILIFLYTISSSTFGSPAWGTRRECWLPVGFCIEPMNNSSSTD